MRSILKSTASWSMFFCLLAAISPALPWSYQLGLALQPATADLLHVASSKLALVPVSAYADWHGAAISVAAGIGFLFLVATGSLRPAPWWRTVGSGIVGSALITFILIYSTRHWNHFPTREAGGLLAVISSTGILFVACLEVRLLLVRGSESSPVEKG